MFQGFGSEIHVLGFRVLGLGFAIPGQRFRFTVLGFRLLCLGLRNTLWDKEFDAEGVAVSIRDL